ncbi:MetQ/NlpA family ABC transporter substrate-binding protein [Nocardioides sp. NPDC126508]
MPTDKQTEIKSEVEEKLPDDALDAIKLGSGRRTPLIIAAVAAIAVIALVAVVLVNVLGGDDGGDAVKGSHFGKSWKIAYQASSASEQAFLEYLDKEVAPDYGVSIKGVPVEDGNQLDQATADGEYIANIYQHKHWLQQVTDSTGMKLTPLGEIFQWSYSVYSAKYPKLEEVPDGGTIALLNDPANTAQALWILERGGYLTFKDGVDPWAATDKDIAANPHHWKFTYIEYGAGPRTLDSVDAVIDYNMSFVDAGTPDSQRIYSPPAPKEFAGQLVIGTEYAKDPQIETLKKIFFDDKVQKYLKTNTDEHLQGQLAPVSAD